MGEVVWWWGIGGLVGCGEWVRRGRSYCVDAVARRGK